MILKDLQLKSLEDLKLSDELDRDAQDLPRKKAQWSEWLTIFAIAYKRSLWELNKIKKERFEHYFADYEVNLD